MAIIQIKQSTKLHFATSQLLAGSRKDYDWCLNACFLIPTSASILALVLAFVFGGKCLLHCRLVPPLNPSFCLPLLTFHIFWRGFNNWWLEARIQQALSNYDWYTHSLSGGHSSPFMKLESFFLFSLLTLLAAFSDQAPSIKDNNRLHLAGSSNCEMIIQWIISTSNVALSHRYVCTQP